MYATLRKSFYWLTMAKDIYQFVANCPSCAKSRPKRNRRTNYLKPFPPSQPLEFMSLDIQGPLPLTKSDNKYLVVFGDRYSKAMRVVAVPNITTEMLAQVFVCYGLLRMRPLSRSWAECSVVISCGIVDYDKYGWRGD
jgi:Integrase zinc binding domain